MSILIHKTIAGVTKLLAIVPTTSKNQQEKVAMVQVKLAQRNADAQFIGAPQRYWYEISDVDVWSDL